MIDSKKTGQSIRNLRMKIGMTQEELAEKTHFSARTIQRIENDGDVEPRIYTLQTIAAAGGPGFPWRFGWHAGPNTQGSDSS